MLVKMYLCYVNVAEIFIDFKTQPRIEPLILCSLIPENSEILVFYFSFQLTNGEKPSSSPSSNKKTIMQFTYQDFYRMHIFYSSVFTQNNRIMQDVKLKNIQQ